MVRLADRDAFQETLGVPAISYSKSREFPAFFSRRSGFEVRTTMP